MTEDLSSFHRAWSAYVDAFMTNRSQLAASLFPEKSAQMWFGYVYSRTVLEELTAWLDDRTGPAEFGAHLRGLRSPASGLHISAVLWSYNFSCLGAALTDPDELDPERIAAVLGYWRQVHDAYRGGGPDPIIAGQSVPGNRVLAEGVVAELAAAVRPPGDLPAQRLIAGLVNYSWLMECESRQGQFTHGLYPAGPDQALLVRDFSDLSGSYYRWAPAEAATCPHGPVSIVLEVTGVEAAFDAFGVARLSPEAYDARIAGVGVVDAGGIVGDPVTWLHELRDQVRHAHPALYRTIAGWSARERFVGGAESYARIWSAFIAAADGDGADDQRLVRAPLEHAVATTLDSHLAAETEPPLWAWARRTDRPTILAPVIELVSGVRHP
jgi:hypothetical protein